MSPLLLTYNASFHFPRSAAILELPVGSHMYLRTTSLMAFMFLTLGCISFYNGYVFAAERRWTYADLTDDMALFANTWAISDYTPAIWTPVKSNACNGHGFAARVCAPRGWDSSGGANATSVYDYECGRAPTTLAIKKSFYSILLDPIGLGVSSCQIDDVVCTCMPGWTGPSCATRRASESLNMSFDGWCRPSRDALAALNGSTRDVPMGNPADLLIPPTVGANVCSGKGKCLLRAPAGSRNFSYTFCSCDVNSWGPSCEFSETATARPIGRFNMEPLNSASSSSCKSGVVPTEDRFIGFASLPIAHCGEHGVMTQLPVDADGKFIYFSSYFRPQTTGVCACEPGYSGEQCLGGRDVSDFSSVGILSAVMAITLLMGSLMLYRERKKMDFHFDATHITPGDFTIFVDNLPDLTADDVPEIVSHFTRWGKVHSVAPAFDDEMLRWWRTRANDLMRLELVYKQLDQAAKGDTVEADDGEDDEWAAGGAPEDSQGGGVAGAANVEAGSSSSDPAGGATARRPTEHIDHRWWEKRCPVPELKEGEVAYSSFATRVYCLPVLFDIMTLSRGVLRKLYWGVRERLEVELKNESVRSFNRCFVTYEKTAFAEAVLEAYQDNDVVFCTCRRAAEGLTHDEGELFRGVHDIKVSQAPEPTEIIWDSLDTSPRERSVRLWICFIILIAFCAGLFNVIMYLPTDQPGITGLLASTAVVVINMFSAQLWWLLSTYAEQQPTEGDKARSVFYKTLFTQLTVMFAANVGVSGVPMDSKNGYIQDFYSGTAGFMMRTTITEAILPPLLSILAVGWRVNLWLSGNSPSPDLAEWAHEPPPFLLAERCASFMRIVIMCCAFSAGMPIMTFLTAACIFSQNIVDTATLTRIYALAPAGPELPRAIESMLIFGSLINCTVSWLTLRDGSTDALVVRIALFITTSLLLWAASGYFSWKWFKGRDCFGGMGFVWLGPVFCYADFFMHPLQTVHAFFMETLLGRHFYQTRNKAVDETRDELRSKIYSQNVMNAFVAKIGGSRRRLDDALQTRKKSSKAAVAPDAETAGNFDADAIAAAEAAANNEDETGGRPYSQIASETPAWELRAHPYCLWERAQLGTWMRPGVVKPPAPPHTAYRVHEMRHQMLDAAKLAKLPQWLRKELEREEASAENAW